MEEIQLTKKCSKCLEIQPVVNFTKRKLAKDGLDIQCKSCKKKYKLDNQSKIKEQNHLWYLNNKDGVKEYDKRRNLKFPERRKEYNKNWELKNPGIRNQQSKIWCKKNKDILNLKQSIKYNTDNNYRLRKIIYSLVYQSLKFNGGKKNSKTYQILGCTLKEFKIYIESKFESWMSWNNQGNPKDGIFEFNKTWDLDHIIPVSSAQSEEELLKLNLYTNFQPLCSKVNREIKRNKI